MFPLRSPLATVWIALNPTQVTKSFTESVDFHLILLQSTHCSSPLICLNVSLQLGWIRVMLFHIRSFRSIKEICVAPCVARKTKKNCILRTCLTAIWSISGAFLMHRGICTLHPCLDHQHSVCLRLTSVSQWFWMRDATADTKNVVFTCRSLSVFNWTFMATVLRSLREWFYCHIQQHYVFRKEWECHCLELIFIHFILYLTRYLYYLFNDCHKF